MTRAVAAPIVRSGGLIGRADAALGRIPMYLLVLWSLVALAALAIIGSLTKAISIAPAPLFATLIVAVAASWLGTRLMATIARAPSFGPSALITGLLLFFILFPTTAPLDLLLVAATALVAAASKFLFVIGGRHVLNPALVAVFLVELTGIGSSGAAWWVATPFLDPFIGLATLLILIRVRLVAPALLLIVLAVVLITVGQLRFGGTSVPEAALTAVAQTPIVFLAGFMFSEPFTLPPRRWHRLLEAVVVALLVALPFFVTLQLLTFTVTPEFALLAGNVLALLLARPMSARMRFAGRKQLTATSTEFSFTPERPLAHQPGQYLELHLPHRSADRRGTRRTLTIVSAPGDPSGEVRVALRTRDPMSSFKQALDVLALGSPVRATTVSGAFTLPRDRSIPLVLVASGIGITPFISQLQAEAALVAAGAAPRDMLLVNRLPSADELPYSDVIAASGVRVLLVCPDTAALADVGLPDHWHVTDRFDAETVSGVLPEAPRRVAYVSGSPRFVADARSVLRTIRVRRIRTDAFAGY